MRVGKFAFNPGLIPSVITFLLLPVLLGLGFWQLDRAGQKEALLTKFKMQSTLPYAPLSEVDFSDPAYLYRKVSAEGSYDNDHQILLDNQIHAGQVGYHVYTPLRLPGVKEAVLINRGWVPLGNSRQQLPDIAVTDTIIDLKGWVAQPANPGLRLPTSAPLASWPRIVQYLDNKQLEAELGYPVAATVILLAPSEQNGYLRDWQPHFASFGPERHRGYAVQWFALAMALFITYIAVNTQRERAKNA